MAGGTAKSSGRVSFIVRLYAYIRAHIRRITIFGLMTGITATFAFWDTVICVRLPIVANLVPFASCRQSPPRTDFSHILTSAKLGAPVQSLIQVAGNPARFSRRENGWNSIFSVPGNTLVIASDEIGAIEEVEVLEGNFNAHIYDADNEKAADALAKSRTRIALPDFEYLIENVIRPMRYKMTTMDDYAFSSEAMNEKGLQLGVATIGEVLGSKADRWIEGGVCELMANFGHGTCVIEAGVVCRVENYTMMLGENACTGKGDPDGVSMLGAEEIAKAHGLFLNLSSGFWDEEKWKTPSGIKVQAEIYRKAFSRIVVSKIEYSRKRPIEGDSQIQR